jgi:hypothetical protein
MLDVPVADAHAANLATISGFEQTSVRLEAPISARDSIVQKIQIDMIET